MNYIKYSIDEKYKYGVGFGASWYLRSKRIFKCIDKIAFYFKFRNSAISSIDIFGNINYSPESLIENDIVVCCEVEI